jgi:hypothetical protein
MKIPRLTSIGILITQHRNDLAQPSGGWMERGSEEFQ